MSDIYMDIIKAQQRQGNLGGKRETDSERKKREKAEKKAMDRANAEKIASVEFNVHIQNGEVFEATDANGLSDPYVTISAVREDGKTTKQVYRSGVQKKTLKPVWDEEGTMKIKGNTKQLIIQLWDQDLLSSNDFIGGASINVSFYGGSTHELDMYEAKDGAAATLKGKVKLFIEKKGSISPLYGCI